MKQVKKILLALLITIVAAGTTFAQDLGIKDAMKDGMKDTMKEAASMKDGMKNTVKDSMNNTMKKADSMMSAPAVKGYDLVSYHTESKPVEGNKQHAAEYDGATYLFANEANKTMFQKNPSKYLPAYDSYCAFGAALGKKFPGDPKVWKVVDNKLYLNLDTDIQAKWEKDIPGNIKKADSNWGRIKPIPASKL